MEIWRLGFLPDFQARWKAWETRLGSFPRFPRGVISTAPSLSECSERSDASSVTCLPVQGSVLGAERCGSFLAALFAHRFAAQLDTVSVVHQPVENAVGQGRITDLLVPLGDR